jgi:hypothetical protein
MDPSIQLKKCSKRITTAGSGYQFMTAAVTGPFRLRLL